MILGGGFVVLVGIAAIGLTLLVEKGEALDIESKAYVDEVVPMICADLRFENLAKHASKELLAAVPPEEFKKVFVWFERLGEYRAFIESSGQVHMNYAAQGDESIIGKYIAHVEFETGPAEVEIVVVKKDDGWKVQMLNIDSPAMMPERN